MRCSGMVAGYLVGSPIQQCRRQAKFGTTERPLCGTHRKHEEILERDRLRAAKTEEAITVLSRMAPLDFADVIEILKKNLKRLRSEGTLTPGVH